MLKILIVYLPLLSGEESAVSVETRRFDEKQHADAATPRKSPFTVHKEQTRVTLTVTSVSLALVFNLQRPIIIGRQLPLLPDATVLDLYPFQARELGVSRHHLTMQLKNRKLTITDNNSSNGTFLNGKLLQPEQAYIVMQGDELLLGHMRILINLLIGIPH